MVLAEPSGLQVTTPVVLQGPTPTEHAPPVAIQVPPQLVDPAAQLPMLRV